MSNDRQTQSSEEPGRRTQLTAGDGDLQRLAETRARQQAVVAELGVRALRGMELATLLQDAADCVAAALDTEFVKILEMRPDGQTATLVAGLGWHPGVVGSTIIRVGRDSQAGYALLTHAPVIVDDLNTETRLEDPPLLKEHRVVSGMSVILHGPGGSEYGVLGAHTASRRRFTQDDVHFLQGVANVVSAALHRRHVEDELHRAREAAEAYASQLEEQAVELEHQTDEAQSLAEELEHSNDELLRANHEAERARETSEFLAEVSRLLSSSLAYEATLETLARAAVPRLGDWCAVDLVIDPAAGVWPPVLERVALVHQDPDKLALGRELAARYPTNWAEGSPMTAVLREGRPVFVPEITDAMIAAVARDPEHLRLLRELHFSSTIVVPLEARGLRLGALTLCYTESERHYTDADVVLAQQLAQRAAVAVDNARLHRDAETARRAAEEANQAKSDFLATMSHELRTPLNAIAGYVQLLAMGLHGPLTDDQRNALERIDRSQRHLLGLINDVLNYARLESGRVEYEMAPVLVADVVREVRLMVEPQIIEKGLTFEACFPEDAGAPPLPVWADREKLAQVVLNLLSNAVKFTAAERDGERGRISVELTAHDREEGADAAPDRVYLHVTDNGVGIPVSRMEAVFEPFVQVRSPLTRETGGTGLGLAISRDLARGMGGDLHVRSTEGVGSTFTLVLRSAHAAGLEGGDRRSGDDRRTGDDRRIGGADGDLDLRPAD